MQLTPRYDGEPLLRFELPSVGPTAAAALVRQRRRLGSEVASLGPDQWSAPSRCEGWSVQDVIAHLVGTNQFWALSISSALAGSPTRFLESFDPVATPAAMVDATRSLEPAAVLERYTESCEALALAVEAVPGDDGSWSSVMGEAPPGYVPLAALALHALWDAWTHERDVLLPLGRSQVLEDDEVRCSLLYAATIGPTLLAAHGESRRGVIAVTADDAGVRFVVDVGPTVVVRESGTADAELRGAAVDLIEGLTFRAPLAHEVPSEHAWMLGGLALAFDLAPG